MTQTTYSAKPGEIERRWYVIDAEGETLGRLALPHRRHAARQAQADSTRRTSTRRLRRRDQLRADPRDRQEAQDKIYYRHSGYHGGLRERTLQQMLDARPEEVIRLAVRGMLPRNKLGRAQLRKLKLYAGGQHPHEAQQPAPLP